MAGRGSRQNKIAEESLKFLEKLGLVEKAKADQIKPDTSGE